MISVEQIRAARGLLNWTQRELAEAAGISARNLVLIEQGRVKPRADTLDYIRKALEKNHVMFTENRGVQLFAERFDIEKYEGPTCIETMLNDTVNILQAQKGEYLLSGTNEQKFMANAAPKVWQRYYQLLSANGISERILMQTGDRYFIGLPSSYRWLDEAFFGTVPYSIYGDRLAIITWGPPVRMVIVRNAAIAETFRRQFEINWANAALPPFARLAKEKPHLNRPRHELTENEIKLLEKA
jgi:transcriptional regulator with XRE-family HTH domain